MRSDRILHRSAPTPAVGAMGWPRRHGDEFAFGDLATWGEPDVIAEITTRLNGPTLIRAWDRLHPRLKYRIAWAGHDGTLPIIEGTVIRLQVDRLPSGSIPKAVWLWHSAASLHQDQVDLAWQAFLRRFDIEHTFRLLKQTLGRSIPKLRSPQAANGWIWLLITAHTELCLARDLTTDLRRTWEQPRPAHRLSPARVHREFRNLRPQLACPACVPKPSRPGPGRPPEHTTTSPLHAMTSTP
ncbi:hypothetical protein ACFPM7_22545 [Actinokineospora guangxiensis]|uniref:Transposase IS4-like domain-containing protein n=1 Tax=Actinokineospora guangxiensis TaxID=1490288 RepID=A0ABW0ETY7_9PSEU